MDLSTSLFVYVERSLLSREGVHIQSVVSNRYCVNHSAIVSQSRSKLHQSTGWSSRHAFSQVRNFVFVTHHTSDVQMGPMRSCDKLSQECSCRACAARTREIINRHNSRIQANEWVPIPGSVNVANFSLKCCPGWNYLEWTLYSYFEIQGKNVQCWNDD